MTALDDALQQAREASVEAGRRLPIMAPEDRATVRALVELLVTLGETLPHLVDTRRLEVLALDERMSSLDFCLDFDGHPWWWVQVGPAVSPRCSTAAEALDAAEREARR